MALSIDTEHDRRANSARLIAENVLDLVDTMNRMNASGRIDFGAFAGEPNMDDEDGQLGGADRDVETTISESPILDRGGLSKPASAMARIEPAGAQYFSSKSVPRRES